MDVDGSAGMLALPVMFSGASLHFPLSPFFLRLLGVVSF